MAARAELKNWAVAWQSAGRTAEPWLGPDVREAIRALAANGTAGVIVCPAGFVCDHLVVLYDLDIECRRVGDELGLPFARTSLPNADPRFLDVLARLVRDGLEVG